jgi:hypothetical protein
MEASTRTQQEENRMSDREFLITIESGYEGDENTPAGLTAWIFEEGEWQSLELGIGSPGFVLFVYTILHCQHLYMRTNAAERGLLLESAKGSISVGASEDWVLERLHVEFEAKLRSGKPTSDDIEYITGRMQQCPVSKNLRAPEDTVTTLSFS